MPVVLGESLVDKIRATSLVLWGGAVGVWALYLLWIRPHLAHEDRAASPPDPPHIAKTANVNSARLEPGTIVEGAGVYDPSPETLRQARPYGHWITIEKPPRSKEACLQESNGIVNEQFVACRYGSKVPVWVSADGSTDVIR